MEPDVMNSAQILFTFQTHQSRLIKPVSIQTIQLRNERWNFPLSVNPVKIIKGHLEVLQLLISNEKHLKQLV